MELNTERLTIREFQEGDADALHGILGDEQVMKHCEPAYSLEKTKQFLQTFCIRRRGAVGAFHRITGELIGYILFCGMYHAGIQPESRLHLCRLRAEDREQ